MKALTNILTRLLMLLLLMLVACTEDAAEVDNLVRGEEYVQVRMQVPGMKAANTRATADDNITSIVALVFREDKLISKTEVKNLTTITSTTGTFNLPRPKSGDVIHFLANVPDAIKNALPETGDSQTEVLRGLETGERDKLSYWGKHEYTGGDINVTLYRNLAMIKIAAGQDCTFPEDELFIAGFINANTLGKLVPYDEETGFNFNLNENDYHTLPTDPAPLAQTDSLTNFGNGYDSSYYVFEHDNPKTEDGLYVICKIGKYFYKVALTSDGVNPYKIIRNHKYTIYVHDLDDEEGARYYKDVLDAPPINLKVIETTDLLFTYTENPTVYLNGGKNATLPVQITVPQDASLTEFNITTTDFTVTSSGGALTQTDAGYTYAGGSTTFTFTPKSGLAADTYPITLSGSGNYLHAFTETIPVTVDATMMEVSPSTATINMDENPNALATLTLTRPGNVDNVNVSQSADVFNVANTDNEYTFTPKNSNIAAGEYTVTFADSNYPNVNTTATITVVNTKVKFTNTGSPIQMNGTPLTVTMNVPDGKSLSEFGIKITPATGLDVAQNGTALTLKEGVYTTTSGVSRQNTFTFTPTATGDYTITFSGSGEGVNMPQESERTINLTVNAAAVTTMSVTAVKGDSTIDLDSDDTDVTFTLTKPSGLQTIGVGVSNTNAFDITSNAKGRDWESNNLCYFNNLTSEEVPFTFTVKNNFETAGEYTVWFVGNYNNQEMRVETTITIVNKPDLEYGYSNPAIYMDDANPQFPVTITVPYGSTLTQLNIVTTNFTVTSTNETGTLTSTANGYTYSGGTTTLIFVPINGLETEKSYDIEFSGTGENLYVPEKTIAVKVEATKPAVTETVLWSYTGDGTGQQLNPWNHFEGASTSTIYISNIEIGDTIGFEFSINTYQTDTYIEIQNITQYKAYSNKFKIEDGDKTDYKHVITEDCYNLLKENNNTRLGVRGTQNVYLTRVYLIKGNK